MLRSVHERLGGILVKAMSESLSQLCRVETMPVAEGAVADPALSAVIGLTGGVHGAVTVVMSEMMGRACAQAMLGEEPRDPAVVRDALGEIANVVAGTFISKLADGGAGIELAVPVILSTAGGRVEVSSGDDVTESFVRMQTVSRNGDEAHIVSVYLSYRPEGSSALPWESD